MRTLTVTNIVSLDGYYEGPDRNVMVLPMDHSFDAYNTERLRHADTLLLGGESYRQFKGFWPTMADNPAASPDHREISRRQNAVEKVVVSDSLKADETDPWQDTTRIVRRARAHQQIAALKHEPRREILVLGSRTLWHGLLAAGLVDEVHLMIGATVLGNGTPAFDAPLPAPLRLLGTRTFDGSDNVLVRYAIGPAAG